MTLEFGKEARITHFIECETQDFKTRSLSVSKIHLD